MKKMLIVVVLGILLIGFGAYSKVNAQFPYQLEHVEKNALISLQKEKFPQLGNQTLDNAAGRIHTVLRWKEGDKAPHSTRVIVSGIANYNFLGETKPFEMHFQVMKNGKMRVEECFLENKSSTMDQIMELLYQTGEIVSDRSEQKERDSSVSWHK